MSAKDKFRRRIKELTLTNQKFPETNLQLHEHSELKRKQLIAKIEFHVCAITHSISDNKLPHFTIKNTRKFENSEFDTVLAMKSDLDISQRIISFGVVNSKAKFVKTVFLLSKVYELLVSRSYCTVRELYYQNMTIFQSQSDLNSILTDVNNLLDALPWEMNLLSSSKGLVAGSLLVTQPSGVTLDFNKSTGMLMPHDIIGLKDFKSNAKFVLVIEKDATFQKLLDEDALNEFGPCIMITGKGYPDVNTRLMLRRIWEELKLPMFVLTDCDPDGIAIMCVYRFGSLAMAQHNHALAVPALRWLGVHPSDVSHLNVAGLPLDSRGQRKAHQLTLRPYIIANPNLLAEVNTMMESQVKCEIEGFYNISPNYLTQYYIYHKIFKRMLL